MNFIEKLLNAIKILISFILVLTAIFSISIRFPQCFSNNDKAILTVAALTLTDGKYLENVQDDEILTEKIDKSKTKNKNQNQNENKTEKKNGKTIEKNIELPQIVKKTKDKTDYYNTYGNHSGEEKYNITEKHIDDAGTECENFYVKNNTGLDIDFDDLLNAELSFKISKKNSPQVLIYHTHTSESFLDENVDFYYESYYSRTQNNDYNVTAVGDVICDNLNRLGINTIHDKTVHDSTYTGSYDRSLQTVESIMEENPEIKVVLDIHRDAIGTDENKVKPVFTYNGKKGAQIMIMSGCDTNGDMGFDRWEENLKFALKLQSKAEEMYKGMARPLNFGYFSYNEIICDGSLLIEVGTDANSIDEVEYTASLLANVLYEVLK